MVVSAKKFKWQWNRGLGWLVLLAATSVAQGCATIADLSNIGASPSTETTVPAQVHEIARPRITKTSKPKVAKFSNSSRYGKKLSPPSRGKVLTGEASWYGPGFNGKRTANGEIFDDSKFTAATKSLPLGSTVRVTNLSSGDAVDVQINDRGPFINGRIIDLSHAAAKALGIVDRGTAKVKVELLSETAELGPSHHALCLHFSPCE